MPHYIYEFRLLKTMAGPICGVDEAGRGPLAGPVVAAAVILDRKRIPKGLNDSKQLNEETREALYPRIMEMAVAVGVGEASVGEIDLVNIRQATHLAMARAVRALAVAADSRWWTAMTRPPCPAAATRWSAATGARFPSPRPRSSPRSRATGMMVALHDEHPGYNWRSNKGYGTPEHYDGLKAHGVTVHHRRSFARRSHSMLPVHWPTIILVWRDESRVISNSLTL